MAVEVRFGVPDADEHLTRYVVAGGGGVERLGEVARHSRADRFGGWGGVAGERAAERDRSGSGCGSQ